MSKPIIIINREAIQYEEVTEEWDYDKILELFPDGDGSLVNPLVRRCQQYEAKIEQLCNIEEDPSEFAEWLYEHDCRWIGSNTYAAFRDGAKAGWDSGRKSILQKLKNISSE
jgi:hypothetical protein